MRKIFFFIFVSVSICTAQTDSMFVEKMDGTIHVYSVPIIKEILFSGLPTTIKARELEKNVLSSFSLYQNYPNPFNPTTNIKYTLPSSGDVSVNIYNIEGRLVRTLFKSFQNVGDHLLIWNSRNNAGNVVSSGTYICQVLFNNRSLVKKLLLIK